MSRLSLAVLIVCAYPSCAAPVNIDAGAVVDWNVITLQAVETAVAATPARPWPVTFLDVAMVHAAIYDAVQAIEDEFEPFIVEIPGARGSPVVAAARAAHDLLVALLPEQAASLDATYHDYLSSHGLDEGDPGATVGQEAAAGVLAQRADDGRFPDPPPPPFIGGTEPGVWRPTPSYLPGAPPSNAPMPVPWLGTVAPFALTDPAQFRAEPPPPIASARYAKYYYEVKILGSAFNSIRTPEQTDTANFWTVDLGSRWNLALRDIATAHIANISDGSRLFAVANLATADAIIAAWDSTSHFVFWRPVTAIQEGDGDTNSYTRGDADWQPMINTPNFPDYTSAASSITGAMTRSLALFFGKDEFTFVFTSENPLASTPTRTYERFSEAAQEVVEAGVYQGIHFRFATMAARQQGRRVASWVFHELSTAGL